MKHFTATVQPVIHGMTLSEKIIENYLTELSAEGYAEITLDVYRRALKKLYNYLPEDKCVWRDTLAQWQNHLLESDYANNTVNVYLAAANGLMLHYDNSGLCLDTMLEKKPRNVSELTRTEYLRLMSTARQLGREQVYLLIMVFGSSGLPVKNLPLLTVEAVRCGEIRCPDKSIRIPNGVAKELLRYAGEQGIMAGPIFLSRAGKPLASSTITKRFQCLSRYARVSKERATIRCLKKLYHSTGEWRTIGGEEASDAV